MRLFLFILCALNQKYFKLFFTTTCFGVDYYHLCALNNTDMEKITMENISMHDLSKLQNSNKDFSLTTVKTNLGDVFSERTNNTFNEFYVFMAHFNTLPNLDYRSEIDCRKANVWFLNQYKHEIKDCHFFNRRLKQNKDPELDDIFYFLDKDLMVYFDINNGHVKLLFRHTSVEKVNEVLDGIKNFKKRSRVSVKPEISLLVSTRSGLDTRSMEITKPKLSIDDNYNDDFKEIHKTIHSRLSKKNDKGLVLLHGKPGTGKTSYIRYIIASVKKNVIFLPPNMATAITNPDLMRTLIENPNSIFVIEDAENIVVDREQNGSSPVSALLNLSDGLLSDCLNIQIICSFNTDISKVDSALLRKGRLIAKYEFKELETNKAQALSDKLGYSSIVSQPMTLTEIYNQEELDFTENKSRRTIGFRVA